MLVLPLGLKSLASDVKQGGLRGKLKNDAGDPVIVTSKGPIALSGDEDSMKVFKDARLNGADVEFAGHMTAKQFAVDPIHTHALFVYQNNKRLNISYWCDICYIRTWSPGKCWCCQEDTKLDPVDPATIKDNA